MAKRSKHRRKSSAERLPPVLTVTCPNCGAAVNDAELGERTSCRFCDTDLHLPRLEGSDDEDAPVPSEAPLRDPYPPALLDKDDGDHKKNLAILIALVSVPLIFWFSWQAPDPPAVPLPAHAPSPELDSIECYSQCVSSCTEIPVDINRLDEQPVIRCMDACEAKCKPQLTASECMTRCNDRCASAPDASSRTACVNGCMDDCQ